MSNETASRKRRSWLLALPLVAFGALALLFWYGLGAGDPSRIPSALIGRPAPQTALPPLDGLALSGKAIPGLDPSAFKGQVSLLNVWASWCVPCHDEAPLLLALSQDKRIRVIGINYKDAPDNARRFLGRYGNPFAAVGADANGRAAIEWGVYGVPETFIVGRDGLIAFKLIGPDYAGQHRQGAAAANRKGAANRVLDGPIVKDAKA